MQRVRQHHFLHIAPAHLGEGAARRAVKAALERMDVRGGHLDWRNGTIRVTGSDRRTRELTFAALVREARETGIPRSLYRWIDGRDAYFGGSLELATDSKAIKLAVQFAGYSRELNGPCRFFPIEVELTDDVLFHRRGACETSASSDFAECSRHFRAYLQSAVSLMDAFLNRYVLLLEHANVPVPDRLRGPSRMDERIDAWVRSVANRDPNELHQAPEWSQFSELRQERNRTVHALEPYLGISIRDVPKFLNAVRMGMGGLLLRMRQLAGQPTLGFIERLRTAPEVSFRGR